MIAKICCLRPACDSIALYRGCCSRHYRQVQNDVRHKRLTWQEAEQRGLCKPFVLGKDGMLNRKIRKGA